MQDEQHFARYADYSVWHRWKSVLRFLPNPDTARALGMIDIDNVVWIEWRKETREPLAVIETALDGPEEKGHQVLARFGELCQRPAFVVRYRLAGVPNPGYPHLQVKDIAAFRVRRVWPNPERGYREMTPKQYAEWLVQIRELEARAFLRQLGWNLSQ